MFFISVALLLTAINLDFVQCMSIRRDSANIVAGLTTISEQLTTMNNTLNSFHGGLDSTLVALKIQGEAMDLDADIRTATSVITESAQLNDADSSTVAFAIVSLSSNIYDVLDNIILKKPVFDSAILGIGSASFLVKSDLQYLKKDTDVLGAALTKKFVPGVAQVAPLVISVIDFHFDPALAVYA